MLDLYNAGLKVPEDITFPVTFEKTGKHILKGFVNQTGIVLDQIAINPDGYGKYYEIPGKSEL